MNTKPAEAYAFKPMKTLTSWTLGLMAVQLIGMIGWITGQTAYLVNGNLYDVLEAPVSISMLLYSAMWLISGIVSLFWIYGAARNAKALRPALELRLVGPSAGFLFLSPTWSSRAWSWATSRSQAKRQLTDVIPNRRH